MANVSPDANQEQAQAPSGPSTEEKKPEPTVSEDAKPQESEVQETDTKSYQQKYEEARKAMRQEREGKKAKEAEIQKLTQRIEQLESRESRTVVDEDITESGERKDPRTEVLWLMNRDPFVKENLDLIEQKMTEDSSLDVNQAVTAVKSELFDRIQNVDSPTPSNSPQKQEKPTATSEPEAKQNKEEFSLKDALAGKVDMNPMQLDAIRRVMPKE